MPQPVDARVIAEYRARLEGPVGDSSPSVELPDAERWLLSGLMAASSHATAAAIAGLIFEAANARFDASGAAAWINAADRPAPSEDAVRAMGHQLMDCLRLTGRGLAWVERAVALDPAAAVALGEPMSQAARLFYRIGWLTIAGGADTLGLSPVFDDMALAMIKGQDRINALLASHRAA
jgi:hypothetical protein